MKRGRGRADRRRLVAVLLRIRMPLAAGLGVAWLILLLIGGHHPSLRMASAAPLVAIIGYAAFDGARAVRRAVRNRLLTAMSQPAGPPIEEIAAALRQLLWEHDELLRSTDRVAPAGRLRWLEKRIADRAIQAARAIGVPHPNRPPVGAYGRSQLRVLLHDLASAGLVLPHTVKLLAPDNRH